jgi:uncharacterized membrane protein YfcA
MHLVLVLTSLGAATVNGALGYGFSSISVPILLLVIAGRVLNPALVIVEVVINVYALWLLRGRARAIVGRTIPLTFGLIPGVIVGALLLDRVAPGDVRLYALAVLLPLILVQASGRRYPITNERRAAVPAGAGIGLLYGLTTISGPPLALFWNNQGLAKDDFKVGLAIVRVVESLCALAAYSYLGLLNGDSVDLLPWIVPGVVIGFPLGHRIVRRVGVETFRRVCMSFDAYLVSFGLSRALADYGVAAPLAYQVLVVASLIDTWMLVSFFQRARASTPSLAVTAVSSTLEAAP